MRTRCELEANCDKEHDGDKWQSDQGDRRRSALAARASKPDQIDRRRNEDYECKSYLQKRSNKGSYRSQVRTRTKHKEHRRHRHCGTRHDRHADVSPDPPMIDHLDISAQHGNQVFRLHMRFSRAIEATKAFSPRCTLTFTADSDMPHWLAASTTLKPSSFTAWIARRILSGSSLSSLVTSLALSVPT